MRVIENTADRLILKGTPGSIRWMIFASLLGASVMCASAWFGSVVVQETGNYLALIPLGIGFAMGLGFFAIGVLTLTVGRMRLEFNRVSGEGTYDVFSPVVDVGTPCQFRLEHIDGIALERQVEVRRGGESTGNFQAKVCRARLRLRKPRRAITLDETENGHDLRVQSIVEVVAVWLDLEVTRVGK